LSADALLVETLTRNIVPKKTLDEIGIQLFAKENFEEAMMVFSEAQKIRSTQFGSTHPTISMVLNNIACCRFSEGNHKQAWVTFLEAREIQQKTAQADLDLLHVGITLSNLGYVLIQMRQYEQAQEMFEEALLVSPVQLLNLAAIHRV
jgi:tetratricopeptide (TPR) repeat protein